MRTKDRKLIKTFSLTYGHAVKLENLSANTKYAQSDLVRFGIDYMTEHPEIIPPKENKSVSSQASTCGD